MFLSSIKEYVASIDSSEIQMFSELRRGHIL